MLSLVGACHLYRIVGNILCVVCCVWVCADVCVCLSCVLRVHFQRVQGICLTLSVYEPINVCINGQRVSSSTLASTIPYISMIVLILCKSTFKRVLSSHISDFSSLRAPPIHPLHFQLNSSLTLLMSLSDLNQTIFPAHVYRASFQPRAICIVENSWLCRIWTAWQSASRPKTFNNRTHTRTKITIDQEAHSFVNVIQWRGILIVRQPQVYVDVL